MKTALFILVLSFASSAFADGAYYNGVPTAGFFKNAKGLSAAERMVLLNECSTTLAKQKTKLEGAGATILTERGCTLTDSPTEPYVAGELQFVK